MASVSHSIGSASSSSLRCSGNTCVADPSRPLFFRDGPRLPNAARLPFRSFNNKYDGGTCRIVGRGPTEFNYDELAEVSEPIFFINDAVCLAKYARSETFFFAHDAEMRVWLHGSITATAVLPIEGRVLGEAHGVVLGHSGPVVHYHRKQRADGDLLGKSREEIADREELFVHSGTIHSLLHFIWFCGFHRAVFIGCDGINPGSAPESVADSDYGYDRRLENRSKTSPGREYRNIRLAQDLLTRLFGIQAVYHGTPGG